MNALRSRVARLDGGAAPEPPECRCREFVAVAEGEVAPDLCPDCGRPCRVVRERIVRTRDEALRAGHA